MFRLQPCWLTICLFALLGSSAAFAQEKATITGQLNDPSGSSIPGAKITITNIGTSQTRTVETSPSGDYQAAQLSVGTYSLRAEAPGFKTYEKVGIALNVGDTVRVDVPMQVGDMKESVTVEAAAVAVQSDSSEVSNLISGQQVAQLAINGRNIAQLATLTPGASADLPDFNLPISVGSSAGISFNGQRSEHNVWMIDGGENYDRGCGGCMTIMPSVDALAEFKTLTSNSSAEFGVGTGGTMNMVLKSGTKTFHGSAYEYFRNDAMDANDYFANLNGSPKPKLRYNIFGFNVGGPVFIPGLYNRNKEKTFFFVNQEWRKIVRGSQIFATAIPQSQRNGDFSALSGNILVPTTGDPAQQARFASLGLTPGQPFPGNRIPAGLIDSNATLFFNSGAMPLPNAPNNNFSGSRAVPVDVPETILRVDHYFTSKLSVMGHYIHDGTNYETATTLWGSQTYPTIGTNFKNPSWHAVVKMTYLISPTLVNEVAYNFNGNNITLTPTGIFAKPQGWNIPEFFSSNPDNRMPVIRLGGLYNVNYDTNSWPWYNAAADNQVRDDLSWTKDKHNFKFGGQFMRYHKNQDIFGPTQGNYSFDGSFTGNAVADMLLGYSKSYSELQIQDRGHWRTSTGSVYATDNWRATSRLTLNLALRWDIVPHAYDVQNRMSNFYPNLYDRSKTPIFNSDGSLNPSGPGFTTVPGVALSNVPFYLNGVGIAGANGIPRGLVNNTYGTVGPRVGFAYDLTGASKTVLRGGFGTFYERIQGNDVYNTGPNPPFSFSPTVNSVYFSNPSISALNGQQAARPFFPASFTALSYSDYKLPTTNDWNLGIQQELARGTVLSVAYVGNQAFHQRDNRNINTVPLNDPNRAAIAAGKYNPDFDRFYPGFGQVTYGETATTSNYHSLQVNLRTENLHGFTGQLAYTYSHSIDFLSGDFAQISNPFDRRFDRGSSDLDRRHIAIINYIYNLPFFNTSQNKFARTALGGWQISGITTLETGTPLTPTLTTDNLGLGGGATARPDTVAPSSGPKTLNAWFNPAAFVKPPLLSFGNTGRASIAGPGRANWNLSLYKSFLIPITEGAHLDFHIDTFNTFNHTQFHVVDTGFGDQNFGHVTSTYDPRVIELGMRFLF
jgi:carboxypeptidase family protein